MGNSLKPVDKAEILSLVDNSLDYLSSMEKKEVLSFREWTKQKNMPHARLPIAEHGLSILIRVSSGNETHSLLFDTGSSPEGIVANVERMGVELSEVEALVLSHGHPDHAGGLLSVIKTIDKRGLPVIVHEDMFKTRGMALSDGTVRKHTFFPTAEQAKPATYVTTKKPYLLADDTILVTGEIPSQTSFEKGLPEHRTLVNSVWVPEPWLRDDRAIVINVKNKGLVVLSGCGHAGVINTVLYARKITGVDELYAVMGGFHLAGKAHEKRIGETVEALRQLHPKLIAPSHCTGWRAMCAIHQAMPEAFIWNSVGNLYAFDGSLNTSES
jgi:7,8-dihydropterin-6-yl-methyl-4-(beta-D-ribofuranosyl)aminobenzene 5'-phosphate synthase